MSVSIAIAGAAGRMGQTLVRAIIDKPGLRLAGGSERPGAPSIGQDLGVLAGLPALGVIATERPDTAAADAEIWIDFTTPAATLAALDALAGGKTHAAIIGTTGFDPAQEQELIKASKRIAIVRSGNFSLGVNLLAALTEQTAARLGRGWDIEILEAHHRRKVDAPSGTALLLGEAAAKGRGAALAELRTPPYDGITGARREGAIGFASWRGGGIVGAHDVVFAAEREVITLSHNALDRAVFADGALEAALWAADKPPGLYSMRDVLGF